MKKFTLRDLFWLVLVVAMGFGWLATYLRQEKRLDEWREADEYFVRKSREFWQGKATDIPPMRED
jgi:hypothetical protein